jgi:hypothetical protein
VLALHGQHAFALGTVIALAESRPDLGERRPFRLVATAAEGRLNIRRNARVAVRFCDNGIGTFGSYPSNGIGTFGAFATMGAKQR